MSTATIHVLTGPGDPLLLQVPALVRAMYAEMSSLGPAPQLAPDGAERWCAGVVTGLERFNRLVLAVDGDRAIGFGHASIKLAPEHLGGAAVGHISHVYVAPKHRKQGLARTLAGSLHDWLNARGATGVELQVVPGNLAGLAFWEALGYLPDLIQLRKR